MMDRIALSANSDVDRARLKAATAPHSGDLAQCAYHSIGWPKAYGRGNPDIRRSEVGSLDMLTSHLYMWQVGQRQRTSWPLVQEKYPQTSTSCHAK